MITIEMEFFSKYSWLDPIWIYELNVCLQLSDAVSIFNLTQKLKQVINKV